MAFIRVDSLVINTAYIAAVDLESHTSSGEDSVAILMVTPKFPLARKEDISHSPHHYEWLEFTGKKAVALRTYFSSLNNVIDLLPSSYYSVACVNS
ncbi:hypothetical protein ACKFKG_25480 [Phormidesmis sp. 146-35]